MLPPLSPDPQLPQHRLDYSLLDWVCFDIHCTLDTLWVHFHSGAGPAREVIVWLAEAYRGHATRAIPSRDGFPPGPVIQQTAGVIATVRTLTHNSDQWVVFDWSLHACSAEVGGRGRHPVINPISIPHCVSTAWTSTQAKSELLMEDLDGH